MSTAGIRSNRGDGYQTLVAFNWALTVLSNPEFQWIEVDSVLYPVDDVVVGKTNGSLICCQCKKNQVNCKDWTVANLADELVKAASLLDSNKLAEVRFYSRSPFGALAKLREHSDTQPNQERYISTLSKQLQKTDAELLKRLAPKAPHLSTYDFLCRTTFETTSEMDRMAEILRERLNYMTTNSTTAYYALRTHLDQLGARMEGNDAPISARHRLTKEDLMRILHKAGSILAPTMDLAQVRTSFAHTSAIGRSWRQDIAGQFISNPVVNDLLSAIDSGKRAILLTGMPGSGKTCVMLALQENLEQQARSRADIVPLFIQSREFADLPTAQEREAQGLSMRWVDEVARMAEEAKVVVLIDSLDVLSISREHNMLSYFLAQIDRLLLVPDVIVITACRDFDRHYDRRIAQRQWDYESKCLPLNWESEIVPLLDTLNVNTTIIDAETRELIKNPRELALFVELAQKEGSFNVVTAQELAQRYLDTLVRADDALGATVMEGIEAIAHEMLSARRLVIPQQRITFSQNEKWLLRSLNVLHVNESGEVTLGHQTLLDVLVISGAVRRGATLNEFINALPPVPFVRPSIRCFVENLSRGDRREFRKQLRAVLTGNSAFHIRRLVAESLAEKIPQDDDWSLIRELYGKHRDVFQIIYTQARQIEWHQFWLIHLVPMLKDIRDVEGMTRHARLISRWKNEDTEGVLGFWTELLDVDWMDGKPVVMQISHYLSKIDSANMPLVAPFLERLLTMPKQDHSRLLGHALARCVSAGVMDDKRVWQYIAGDITEQDVLTNHFDNKLNCQVHEFGNSQNKFLLQRMEQSTPLLDLAVSAIEQWSKIIISRYGNTLRYLHGNFISLTSYEDVHSQNDRQYKDCERVLFDAIESAILKHAGAHSEWWQNNRKRLCSNHEGALRYFAILACTKNPVSNIDLIGQILSDQEILGSDLSFELGSLMQTAFIYLEPAIQDKVFVCISSLFKDELANKEHVAWVLRKRAELISTIPLYLRTPAAQKVLDDYEQSNGIFIRQPEIRSRGGTVTAPFSYEKFLQLSDDGVLRLLTHYSGYKRDLKEFLLGGEREVGMQLRKASLSNPTRFLGLLKTFWNNLPKRFRYDIMDGVADYVLFKYGNVKTNEGLVPIEDPDTLTLLNNIIDELENHQAYWHHNRTAASALKACAHITADTQQAERLVFLALAFNSIHEEIDSEDSTSDLITKGWNMVGGQVAEALMILANNLLEHNVPFPDLLPPTLCRTAGHEHPGVRALILRYLPYLQYHSPELGWDLFHRSMRDSTGLWEIAGRCLYYNYHHNFDKVSPLLKRIYQEGSEKDMETWGRISALAALVNHVDIEVLLNDLKEKECVEAWEGAAGVWTHPENIKMYRELCIMGLQSGLNAYGPCSAAVSQKMEMMFHKNEQIVFLPIKLFQQCVAILENDQENKQDRLFGFDEWLNNASQIDPEQTLALAEVYLAYVSHTKAYLYNYENNLTQLMTRLFAEAEEREESDRGEMLQRVVSLQDTLLTLGVEDINDWLKAAERP